MKPLTWEKIEISTHLTPKMTSFHVDTKNFMYLYDERPLERYNNESNDEYFNKFNKLHDLVCCGEEMGKEYLIPMDKIVPFIFSMREMRKLQEAIGNVILPKNLRFFRYKNNEFIVTDDCKPIKWEGLSFKSLLNN